LLVLSVNETGSKQLAGGLELHVETDGHDVFEALINLFSL
jgi:hypothetical protein